MKVIYSGSDAGLKAALFELIKKDMASIPAGFERVLLAVPRQSTFSVEEEALDALGGKGFMTERGLCGKAPPGRAQADRRQR